jgi:hypothetical protein
MFLIILAAAAIIGLVRGGSLSNITKLKLVYPWLIFLSALMEISLQILMHFGVGITQTFIFICSILQHALVFLFIWFNRHLPYIWIIALGSFLNALVILLNGGSMPLKDISPYIAKSRTADQYLLDGRLLTYHFINEKTKLWFLGDIIWLPFPSYAFASIGDLFLYGGVSLLIHHVIAGKAAVNRLLKKKQSA